MTSPLPPGGNLGLTAVLLALIVLATAKAFRRGRRLAEDTEGLV